MNYLYLYLAAILQFSIEFPLTRPSAGIDEEGIEVPITCQREWGDVRSFELQQFAQHLRMDSVILTFYDR